MKYECIKDYDDFNCKVGDVVQINKNQKGYIVDGFEDNPLDTEITYNHFKKKRLEGWKFSPYSHSKIETWIHCPKKFEWNYIIKPPSEPVVNPVLEKGTLFHGILEFHVIDKLDEFELSDTFKALTKKDAENIIGQALDFVETSETYNWIKSLNGVKVPEQEIFLGPDLKPVNSLEESLVRGFIDLIIFDEKSKSCYIFDWKTGGKSKEDLKKWPKSKDQLELYAVWAHQTYDVEHIETAFIYVEHDHMTKYVFEKSDMSGLKNKIKDKINNIETDKSFKKNLSQLCAWCDFKEPCLGIDMTRDPRSISKEEIFNIGKNKPKQNSQNSKNSAFLNKIKSKN